MIKTWYTNYHFQSFYEQKQKEPPVKLLWKYSLDTNPFLYLVSSLSLPNHTLSPAIKVHLVEPSQSENMNGMRTFNETLPLEIFGEEKGNWIVKSFHCVKFCDSIEFERKKHPAQGNLRKKNLEKKGKKFYERIHGWVSSQDFQLYLRAQNNVCGLEFEKYR